MDNLQYFNQSVIAKKSKKNAITRYFLGFLISTFVFLIILKPNLCINSISTGLSTWAKIVLPSLFPFMFFTKFLSSLDVFDFLTKKMEKLMKFLFKAPAISSYVFLMSIISGYPMGAKLISEFYQKGKLTSKQANKLSTFCSTSGPIFIVGSVGTAMFLNSKIGYILLFSHILATILNGIIFRNAYVEDFDIKKDIREDVDISQILPDTMQNSILSVMIVGGYIAIFFLIIDIFNEFSIFQPIFHLMQLVFGENYQILDATKSILFGIIEMSKGCLQLSTCNLPIIVSSSIASFLIGFGGLCTFFQAITFLSKCKVNLKFYIFQKFVQGLLSFAITFLLVFFFL